MAKTCKLCGKRRSLSVRGLCSVCSTRRNQLVVAQLRSKSGEFYEKWKANRLRAMRKLLDAEKPLPDLSKIQQPREPSLPELPQY